MQNYLKIILSLVFVILILLSVFIATAPRMINLESFRSTLVNQLSSATGGNVKIGIIGITFFPTVNINIKQVSFETGKHIRFSGNFNQIFLYPKIIKLFQGKIEVKKILIDTPDIKLNTGDFKDILRRKHPDTTLLDVIQENLIDFSSLSSNYDEINLKIGNGSLKVYSQEKAVLEFRNINSLYETNRQVVKLDISCNSNLSESVNLKATLDIAKSTVDGLIQFIGAEPHSLTNFFYPDSRFKIMDSNMDMILTLTNFDFNSKDSREIVGEISGRLNRLELANVDRKSLINGNKFNAKFKLDNHQYTLSIKKLELIDPGLQIKGDFLVGIDPGFIDFSVSGKNFQVSPVRGFANSFFAGSGLSGKIFNVVRGGEVRWIKVSSRAASFNKLFRDGNYDIRGYMKNGDIYVPKLDWIFNDVSGYAEISDHILTGKNLKGRHESTYASNGKLTVGLTKKKDVLNLDSIVSAKLTKIQEYISYFARNEKLVNEISSIKDIEGNAKGRLVVGDKKSSYFFKINASDIDLKANYYRVPSPFRITGGTFIYERSKIQVDDISGSISNSKFSGLFLNYNWGEGKLLEIKSIQSELPLNEFYPWLTSYDFFHSYLKKIKIEDGKLDISKLIFRGNPLLPSDWQFQINGKGLIKKDSNIDFSFDVQKYNNQIEINNLELKDVYSDLKIKLYYQKRLRQLEFTGNLSGSTLVSLIDHDNGFDGYINGDIKLDILDDLLVANGELESQYLHCGLYTKGKISGDNKLIDLNLKVRNEENELGDAIECLYDQTSPITGKYQFSVDIDSNGEIRSFKNLINGEYSFNAKNGTIRRKEKLLFKIFSILNISTLLKGKIGTITDENLTYTEINSSGKIENGKFVIKNGELYGPSTGMLANGYIDPVEKNMDIRLKTTPFESIDWIMRIIPLLEKVQTKNFIFIPIHVVGWFDNAEFKVVN